MEDFIKYNYHTHTWRCTHAQGTEREYIEKAIEYGIKRLGFSDHIPYEMEPGYVSTVRMPMSLVKDYRDTLRGLQAEYADRIEILVGFEAEYIPEKFQEMMDMVDAYQFDYLILGQHFFNTEEVGPYTGRPTDDEGRLREYAELLIAAMRTGRFLYVAHPDIMNYQRLDSAYEWEMTRVCMEAKKLHIPLELNVLGFANNKQYPSERFFQIASEVGNDVILGLDAHDVAAMCDVENYRRCVDLAHRLKLNLIDGADLI